MYKMYRSVLFKRFPLQILKTEIFPQAIKKPYSNISQVQWARQLSVSFVNYKKRRTGEEKAVQPTHGRSAIRYSPKASGEVVGIWRNMTVDDIAQVLGKDVEHILKTLTFADKTSTTVYEASTVIHNPQIVRDVVKLCGFRFKLVPRPDQEVSEEENRDAVPAPPAPESELRPRPPVVCVMGHVDHGKTTLLDALRDTAVVDQEFGGITQHIGAFVVKLPSGDKVTFLDTPGHAAFTAMRSRGALATDIVALVVAADDGVCEQTVESIRMATEADVPILVVVNKIDKPGVNIARTLRSLSQHGIIVESLGWSVQAVQVSALKRTGLDILVEALTIQAQMMDLHDDLDVLQTQERTLRSLSQHGIIVESLGGSVQAVQVSALKRTGLDTLVEALTIQAQIMDLKAPVDGYMEGVVIEAQLDPKTGKQATVLVQRGTLRRGCVLVAGHGWGKVRVLNSAEGEIVQEAPPSTPVSVLGWRELPAAGDTVLEVASEKRAHEVMRWRHSQRMKEKQAADLEAITAKEAEHQQQYKDKLARKRALGRFKMRPEGPREKMFKEDNHPHLNVIVKGDVDGSVEAILDILETYDEHDRVKLDLVHFGVGPVTPNDIEIAEAFKATIYSFNVDCPPQLTVEAKNKDILVKHHNIIYRLLDDIKEEISERLPKELEEEILGEANVLQQFHVSEGRKKVPVAGCRCVKGTLQRNALYRLVRGQEVVYEGKLASMKHLKDEVTTIKRDMECGLRLEDVAVEVKPGDTIICYTMTDKPVTVRWDPGF